MRFSETLQDKQNPAWRTFYINYNDLKELLYDGIAKAPKITNAADTGRYDYAQYVARFDGTFFKMISQELDKVNAFFKDPNLTSILERCREYNFKFTELKQDADVVQTGIDQEDQQLKFRQNLLRKFGRKSRNAATEETLKQSFTDLYIELLSLSKFQDLNYTGFRKILKKRDKLFGGSAGLKILHEKVETSRFHSDKSIFKLIEETESIVTTVFEGGSRAKAMKRLRLPHRDDKLNAWTAFKLGVMVGTVIVLFTVLAVSGQIDPRHDRWRAIVRFYRGPAVLDLYLCLLGVNIYLWRQKGINHVFIFDLDPRDNLVHHHFWNISAVFGLAWAVSLVLFLNSSNIGIPLYASPFFLLCIQILFLCNPFPCLYWSSRKWLWKILFRIFTAPFHRVSFADFWMCDQLSSLIALVLDYQFMCCFYMDHIDLGLYEHTTEKNVCYSITNKDCQTCDSPLSPYRPIIRGLPSLLRIIQCFRRFYDAHLICPHLVNAFKYFLALLAVLFSALHSIKPDGFNRESSLYVWIGVSISASLVSFFWDIKMDWGLGDFKSDNRFLRPDLLYSSVWFYYAAICMDFFLRFSWAISLSLTEMGFLQSDIMLTITTPAEIFRRFVWNCFRLEHEQINNNNSQRLNTLQLAASVTSMVATEEQQMKDLILMMDLEDGVVKHRSALQRVSSVPSSHIMGTHSSNRLSVKSNTELFTRNGSQQDMKTNSEYSSNEHVPTNTFSTKLKNACCCCFRNSKN